MDFTPDPEQQAVADVVTSVLTRDNSWDALVAGGVAALGVPERLGGDGVGLPEITTALTEIGRHGTTGPALTTLGTLLTVLDTASGEQQDRLLAGVPKGAVLVAYTDGLVERRGEIIDRGLERLRAQLVPQPAETVCSAVIDALVDEAQRDDIAVVAVRRAAG